MSRIREIDKPLDEYVGYATHVLVICRKPTFDEGVPCDHRVIMLTSDLCKKLPKSRSVAQMKERLVCSRCGRRGWLSIEPARR